MKPITELELRLELKDSPAVAYRVPAGTILTPSSKEYLNYRKIEMVEVPAEASPGPIVPAPEEKIVLPAAGAAEKTAEGWSRATKRLIGPDGGFFETKPEGLTHVYGSQLVPKDHPIIVYRGRLDAFTASLIKAQLVGVQEGRDDFICDLEEILSFCRGLLAAELKKKSLGDFNLLGLSALDIRERSHNPLKFFGHRHMQVSYQMGPLCVTLNSLRAEVRQLELAAFTAFKNDDYTSKREDIILALNRLSSLFYILMYKYLPAGFEPQHSGI